MICTWPGPSVRALGVLLVVLASCIAGEGDERCGENQTFSGFACTCVEGAVPGPDGVGCVLCGEHEVIQAQQCVCEEGYARTAENQPCVEQVEGLGQACDPDNNVCPEDFPLCDNKTGREPICTNSCESNDDCGAGYVCTPKGDESLCALPPTGVGEECTQDADCAGFDANACSSIGVCLIVNCSGSGDSRCPGDAPCCDFRSFGFRTVCIEPGVFGDAEGCPQGIPVLGGEE